MTIIPTIQMNYSLFRIKIQIKKRNIDSCSSFISFCLQDSIFSRGEHMNKDRTINDRRFIEIGLKVAYYRKLNGLTQEQLAEKINLSSRYISKVETPSIVQPISLKALFAIADVFMIPPQKLLDFE